MKELFAVLLVCLAVLIPSLTFAEDGNKFDFLCQHNRPEAHIGGPSCLNGSLAESRQKIVKEFGVDKFGAPLFFPNSDAWNEVRKNQVESF